MVSVFLQRVYFLCFLLRFFSLLLVLSIYWFIFIKQVKSSLASLEFGFSLCGQGFYCGYQNILLLHCLLHLLLTDRLCRSEKKKKSFFLYTLEKYIRMVCKAIASTTWAEGSQDPKEWDSFSVTVPLKSSL